MSNSAVDGPGGMMLPGLRGTATPAERSTFWAPEQTPTLADTIHRRYFIAAILAVTLAGALVGSWMLWQIGGGESFTAVAIHPINAHGHAMIFGWVGLFIMGFAYQAFPRMWRTTLAWPRLAVLTFVMMLAGLLVTSAAIALSPSGGGPAVATMLAGMALHGVAVAVFVMQITVTFVRSGRTIEPYVGFIGMALAWFAVQTLFGAWHQWQMMTAEAHGVMLWQLATYQPLLRNMQIHGMAMFMVLGVSLRMLPAIFGVSPVPRRIAWAALGILTAAVCTEVLAFAVMRLTGAFAWGRALWAAWLMLAVGCAMIVWHWRLWRPLPKPDRAGKFVRAAYAWLIVSLVLLLAMPVYMTLVGLPFSHAYYGAVRHAATVGFISMMIMGMAAKVVPTLNGIDPRELPGLWLPFILVNLGCAMGVVTQVGSDLHAGFFQVAWISGVLELTALAIWGSHIVRLIQRGRAEQVEGSRR